MQPANEPTERPAGRLTRARVLYRNVSKRRLAWLLLKDTVNSCMQYRVTGLAAEAAFFCLLSLPPLLLGLIGLLGYMEPWIGHDTIDTIRQNILGASATVLSDKGVAEIAKPLLDDVFTGRRPDVISLGFAIALWSGSRALNVFVDTITIMYGLDGRRGIVRTRLLAFVLYLAALVVGAIALPLMVAGPDTVVSWMPASEDIIRALYWPVVLILSVAFLTTLYHVSVPVRSPWPEDIPGAVAALGMWVLGSFLLRIYLTETVEGPTVYGSLAAPVAVLLWIGVSAFAVLVGAAMNAALDRVWPSVATAAGRAEKERRVREQAAKRAAADAESAGEPGVGEWGAGLAGAHESDGAYGDDRDDGSSGGDGAYGEGRDDSGGGSDRDRSGDGGGAGGGAARGPGGAGGCGGGGEAAPPSEFPERWAQFLPPGDVRSRLYPQRRHGG